MARTKSTESTSSENSKPLEQDLDHASPPSVKYERSPVEQAIIDRYRAKHRQQPTPKMRFSPVKDGVENIQADHPDAFTGGVMMMSTLGTVSDDFYQGLVMQLVKIGSGEEQDLNFALSCVQGVRPRDEVEGMLAAQMAATHLATMSAATRLTKVQTIEQQDSASRMLNQCSRTFAALVESLKKYRSNGEQCIRVQHVNVGNGGQAVITDSLQTGGGGV
jgi:hypothetical protein